jgi:hypothetical protein
MYQETADLYKGVDITFYTQNGLPNPLTAAALDPMMLIHLQIERSQNSAYTIFLDTMKIATYDDGSGDYDFLTNYEPTYLSLLMESHSDIVEFAKQTLRDHRHELGFFEDYLASLRIRGKGVGE